jgi:hypothetical protein
MAFLKLLAFVLAEVEVVMQKAVDPQLDSYTYVMLPTVVVPPFAGRLLLKTIVPVVVAAATATVDTPTVAVAVAAVVGVPPENPTVGNAV